jgi:hypothetical protein
LSLFLLFLTLFGESFSEKSKAKSNKQSNGFDTTSIDRSKQRSTHKKKSQAKMAADNTRLQENTFGRSNEQVGGWRPVQLKNLQGRSGRTSKKSASRLRSTQTAHHFEPSKPSSYADQVSSFESNANTKQSDLRPSSINFTRANMLLNAQVNWTPTRPILVSNSKRTFGLLSSQSARSSRKSTPTANRSSTSTSTVATASIDRFNALDGPRPVALQPIDRHTYRSKPSMTALPVQGQLRPTSMPTANEPRSGRLSPQWIVSGPFVEHSAQSSDEQASLLPAPSPVAKMSDSNRQRLTQVLNSYFRLMGNVNQNFDSRQPTPLTSNSSAAKQSEMKFQRLAGQLHDQLLDESGQPIDLSDHVVEYIQPEATNDYMQFVASSPPR